MPTLSPASPTPTALALPIATPTAVILLSPTIQTISPTPTTADPTSSTVSPSQQSASTPTSTSVPVPTLTSMPAATATTVPTSIPVLIDGFDPFKDDRNCGDFIDWQTAQSFFVAAGGTTDDAHQLDGDNDGTACESLPGAP